MFDDAQLQDLYEGLAEIRDATGRLAERCVLQAFATPEAEAHARHGLARRVGTLGRCVERVYEVLPPEEAGVPDRDDILEATAHIQAFVMNAFGACDNLAWIWVLARNVRLPNGAPLTATRVGLGVAYPQVRAALTPALQDLLDQRQPWFAHLKDFRDSLAHRIPLYIPPFMVDPADGDRYTAHDQAAGAALAAGDLEAYARHTAARDALRHFKPLMLHSMAPGDLPIIFHVQLQADLNTVLELSTAFLDAL